MNSYYSAINNYREFAFFFFSHGIWSRIFPGARVASYWLPLLHEDYNARIVSFISKSSCWTQAIQFYFPCFILVESSIYFLLRNATSCLTVAIWVSDFTDKERILNTTQTANNKNPFIQNNDKFNCSRKDAW